MQSYNSICFTPEQVVQGLEDVFLTFIRDYNKTAKDSYIEYKFYCDGYCNCYQWLVKNFNSEYTGTFEFVDCDQFVMTEKTLPDNSTIMVFSEEEFNDRLEEFLEEEKESGRTWIKDTDRFNSWYCKEEREAAQAYWDAEVAKSRNTNTKNANSLLEDEVNE